MWVRSQNRLRVIDCKNLSLSSVDEFFNVVEVQGDREFRLGGYPSVQQAMQVLDDIQERINEGCPFVYQMPEDKEEE